jgi:hypothetical protein
MKKSILAVFSCVLLLSAIAHAGLKSYWPVYVDKSARYAYGELGAARNSPDSLQALGCRVESSSSGYADVYCFARDTNGNGVGCIAFDAGLIGAAAALRGDGYLYFVFDENSLCTYIEASSSSTRIPKAL